MKNEDKIKEELKRELAQLRINLAERELFEVQTNWTNSRIKVERRKLERVLNSLPNGILMVSDDHEVLFQNKWMRDRFRIKEGYPAPISKSLF